MPRKKNWIDRAVETGDWKAAAETARRKLQSSSRRIQAARTERPDWDAPEKIFERIDSDAPPEPVDPGDDRVQEYLDDEFKEGTEGPRLNEELPSDDPDEQEEAPTRPVVRLAQVYEEYRERGGDRVLEERVLNYFASMDVEQIDRSTIIAGGRKLYPKHSQAVRTELVHDPLAEILGGVHVSNIKGTVARRRIPLRGRLVDHIAARQGELEYCEEEDIWLEAFLARGFSREEAEEKAWKAFCEFHDLLWEERYGPRPKPPYPYPPPDWDPPPDSGAVFDSDGRTYRRMVVGIDSDGRTYPLGLGRRYRDREGDWARIISKSEPPADVHLRPVKGTSSADHERYKLRGFYRIDPPKMGRPRKANKLTDAERSRRHRAKKEKLRNA